MTATEDEGTKDFLKNIFFFQACDMQDDGGAGGPQVGAAGTDISSTPCGDVEMLEGQAEKVTVDVLSRRILEYGLVKAERATNLVWHYFRKF